MSRKDANNRKEKKTRYYILAITSHGMNAVQHWVNYNELINSSFNSSINVFTDTISVQR